MKKYLIGKLPLIQSILPFVHTIVTLWLVYLAMLQTDKLSSLEDNIQVVKKEVSCEYFINIQEWVDGTCMTYSTTVTSRSMSKVLEEFEEQCALSANGCSSGACIDSARVIMYQDCTGNYDIEVFKDTLIVLPK